MQSLICCTPFYHPSINDDTTKPSSFCHAAIPITMPRSKSVRKKGGRLGRKPRRLAADVFAEGPSGGDDPALPSVEHDDDAMDFDIGGDLEPSDDSASESLDEGEDVAVASGT